MPIIIWGIYAGFVIAGILSYYNKNYLGAVVRALVKKGATSPENALTFDEAGVKGSALRCNAVFGENALAKYVKIANPEECAVAEKQESAFVRGLRKFFCVEKKKKYDSKKAKLYVLEEKRIQAELRYTAKGTSAFEIIIGIIAAFVVAVVAIISIPYILDLVDSVITLYKKL